MEEADYIRIDPAVPLNKWCVLVMRYNRNNDEFVVFRCSQPLLIDAAVSLAKSWAATMGLEIR